MTRPSSKSGGSSTATKPGSISARSQSEKRLALLLVSLALAASFCFGSAFYLFKTRWESPAIPPFNHLSDLATASSSNIQANDFNGLWSNPMTEQGTHDVEAKYLAYLPHSGFHNQRIAFENALVLARILNRTLLVPPVRLGSSVLQYDSFEKLKHFVEVSEKTKLRHCANVSSWSTLPVKCRDYFDYTFVPWDWLVNLTSIMAQQPLITRWNVSDAWLQYNLHITPNDAFSIKDRHEYHYRFVDNNLLDIAGSRYDESVSISLLDQVQHRLLHFGTLHGSSRLRLRVGQNIDTRTQIRKAMIYSNQDLADTANLIGGLLGGDYLAVHVRIEEKLFSRNSQDNARLIWWKLLHKVLGFSSDSVIELEKEITGSTGVTAPRIKTDLASIRVPHPSLPPLKAGTPYLPCRGRLHPQEHAVLNTPLYISTDAPHPEAHPSLRLFFKAFPCTFFLSDFKRYLSNISHSLEQPSAFISTRLYANTSITATHLSPSLSSLVNPYDGLRLQGFLLPFLDAMVAGRAWSVVGTHGSTFSQFVEDVLWRSWKGWEIVQRG